MNEALLTQWRNDLESQLSELEKKISTLQLERNKINTQLGAVVKLLSTINTEKTIEEPKFKNQGESEATIEFISRLERLGWSVDHIQGRTKTYEVSRGDKRVELWLKFSVCNDPTGRYWFGIAPEDLNARRSRKGGVIILLGASDRYLCFPFAKLLELLNGSTNTRTGQKFHILEKSGHFSMLPVGTGEWIEVSSYYGNLSIIGLD